jgi:callose synthase
LNADILEGYETAEKGNRALFARLEAPADMKYTYIVSCQSFALQKAMNDPRYKDTIELMTR